jgi:uncharacterized protein YllA (UPF0747 family)
VIDASHPDVARAGRPLLQKALTSGDAVAAAAARRTQEIVDAGYKPQVDDIPGLSLVFLNADGTKRRLPIAEAKGIEQRRDTYLSSTVLLRPVLERAIVPTAAYVAGPGEFAYFAQVSAVADALSVASPLVMPGSSVANATHAPSPDRSARSTLDAAVPDPLVLTRRGE